MRTLHPILELGRVRHLERGLEATPSPESDCQRSVIILQIIYPVIDYRIWVMPSTIKRGGDKPALEPDADGAFANFLLKTVFQVPAVACGRMVE